MKYKVEEILNKAKLFKGDNLIWLKSLADNSVDSVVTDPPYLLSFMGKKWDHDVPSVEFWKEVYRVLKPGGHVLSFGGTRTYHRMTVNIEDAGFEIRDQIMWIYGSGFPKSHNIGKAVDKIEGNERKKIRSIGSQVTGGGQLNGKNSRKEAFVTEGSTELEGWGTALKPANEPICVARKPLSEKTVALNALKYGTGGLNIEESRIESGIRTKPINSEDIRIDNSLFGLNPNVQRERIEIYEGRFPSNVIMDEYAGNELDEEQRKFFCCPKVSKKERNLGMKENVETFIQRPRRLDGSVIYKETHPEEWNHAMKNLSRKDKTSIAAAEEKLQSQNTGDKNIHPTVKPVDLMRYLIKLVTPKNGVICDPFMGSGSTGVGTLIEDFNFIGMEMDQEYFEIAKQRIQNFEEFKELL
ncbi:MAG: site-specific DNA-methyltransferase, partial [Bacteroidetes bacterium]|nr:site-specific DNA-methyltransferase [Bacteroidota bacterium]